MAAVNEAAIQVIAPALEEQAKKAGIVLNVFGSDKDDTTNYGFTHQLMFKYFML